MQNIHVKDMLTVILEVALLTVMNIFMEIIICKNCLPILVLLSSYFKKVVEEKHTNGYKKSFKKMLIKENKI